MQRAFPAVSAARKHLHQAPSGNIFLTVKKHIVMQAAQKMFQSVIIRNEFVTHQNDLTVKA
jgi:hypothetical protein